MTTFPKRPLIRQAQIDDYIDIVCLRNALTLNISQMGNCQYRVKIQQSGFLAPSVDLSLNNLKPELSKEEYISDLQKIYLIYKETTKIEGYLRIDEERGLESDDQVDWIIPDMERVYFSTTPAEVGGIAVSTNQSRKRIATDMLQMAIDRLKRNNVKYLFSFVIVSPITNTASLLFHEKNGFERVGILKPCFLYGLNNFQSILYARKI
jgi:ribosomal protein S18 acetylase RimI-like enzyme